MHLSQEDLAEQLGVSNISSNVVDWFCQFISYDNRALGEDQRNE